MSKQFENENELTEWLAGFYNETIDIEYRGKIFTFKKELPIGKIMKGMTMKGGEIDINTDSLLTMISEYSHDPKISVSQAKLFPMDFIQKLTPIFTAINQPTEKKKIG